MLLTFITYSTLFLCGHGPTFLQIFSEVEAGGSGAGCETEHTGVRTMESMGSRPWLVQHTG